MSWKENKQAEGKGHLAWTSTGRVKGRRVSEE